MFSEKSLFLNAYAVEAINSNFFLVPQLRWPLQTRKIIRIRNVYIRTPLEAAILKAWLSPNMAAASDVATFGHVVANKEFDAIFVAPAKLQLQNRTCKPGAICRRDIARVSNMFETCCNFSATKVASSWCDKNRLCKRALIQKNRVLSLLLVDSESIDTSGTVHSTPEEFEIEISL